MDSKLRPEVRPAKAQRSRRARIAIKVAKWSLIGMLALGALGAATIAGMLWVYGSDPKLKQSFAALEDYKPKQVTRIYSADNKLIGEVFEERRTYVPLERIAPIMVQAIIDAEDAHFREHEGIDMTGMMRALWVNVRHGETKQGASTITQQVVKTFLLTPERTMRRKVQEVILARRLENTLGKDEILTLYLNQIYFGHGRYGVEEAARFYFGKTAFELTTAEAALLAGLPQSPERLSPFKHPEAAKKRQIYVLNQLVANDHLKADVAQKIIDDKELRLAAPEPYLGAAPEFVEMVGEELARRYGADELSRLGLTVRTTIDVELQAVARTALEKGLRAVDERHGYRGAVARLGADEKALDKKRKALARELGPGGPREGPREGQSYEALVVSIADDKKELLVDVGGWKGAVILGAPGDERYNADKKKPSERFAPGDVIMVRVASELGKNALALDLGPQGAIVVIDPKTRHVLAMVGGYGYQAGQFNRATRAKRQPGSAFKPFVYAAALDSGKFTAATIVNDAPEVYDLWKPKNYEKKFLGPIRLRTALANSVNTVAIRVLHDIGVEAVIGLAHAMGITSDLPDNLSLALGSGVVSPLELVNAYTTFAAEGVFAAPVFLTMVGNESIKPGATAQALRPEVAYLTTSLMESVVQEGTATAARKALKRRMAGKTGTSNSGKDAWFVGFTPDLVAGVWIGFDDMRELGRGETGGKAALPVWIDFMQVALKGRGQKTFRQPPQVVTLRIDRKTGKVAAPGSADSAAMDEVFLEGTQPTEVAPADGEVDPTDFVTGTD